MMNYKLVSACALCFAFLAGCSVQQPATAPVYKPRMVQPSTQNNRPKPSVVKNSPADTQIPKNPSPTITLPADADLSKMSEQMDLIKSGVYLNKQGEIALLPSAKTTSNKKVYIKQTSTLKSLDKVNIESSRNQTYIPLK